MPKLSGLKFILIFSFCICVICSCKFDNPLFKTNPSSTNGENKAAYFIKVNSKLPVKIACEGTSLTYGQNDKGSGIPINGATQHRAIYQYPETLQIVLRYAGLNAAVINRGFPGDRTTEGLKRWQDSTVADVVIIEYGTNDCFNFGNYPSGPLPVNAFADSLSKIVKRRIDEGAWVIINLPTSLYPDRPSLDAYKNAIINVAANYSLPIFDVQKNVIASSSDYEGAVHLTADAYQKWGVKLAPFLKTP